MAAMAKMEAKAACLVRLMERMKCTHTDPTKFVVDQIDNVFVCLRNNIKQPWNDWTLKVDTSTIQDAGRGLFLQGHAPAGRLLCLYSGELWLSDDIDKTINLVSDGDMNAAYDLEQLLNGTYTYARDNGSLIDATPCEKLHSKFRDNPLCLGYIINHPRKGNIPNLLQLDAPYSFNYETQKYCPTWNKYDKDFIDNQITIFLAMTDIKDGDELFFDYDLEGLKDDASSSDKVPSWYHSILPSAYES